MTRAVRAADAGDRMGAGATGPGFSTAELMVCAGARVLQDGQVAVLGLGIPQVAGALAQRTHAPALTVLNELGIMDPRPVEWGVGNADPRHWYRASVASSFLDVMGMVLHRGLVDVGFLGALEVDAYGNANATEVPRDDGEAAAEGTGPGASGPSHGPGSPADHDPDQVFPALLGRGRGHGPGSPGDAGFRSGPSGPRGVRRFGGGGGANDIASLARQTVLIVRHEKRKLVERVHHCTNPGFLTGGDARQQAGLRGGGPAWVLTDLCVFGFEPATKRMQVHSIHPGVSKEALQEHTGFALDLSHPIPITPEPTPEELRLIREVIDPHRRYT